MWDYAGDGYVHRLLSSLDDGKVVELARPGRPDDVIDAEMEVALQVTTLRRESSTLGLQNFVRGRVFVSGSGAVEPTLTVLSKVSFSLLFDTVSGFLAAHGIRYGTVREFFNWFFVDNPLGCSKQDTSILKMHMGHPLLLVSSIDPPFLESVIGVLTAAQ